MIERIFKSDDISLKVKNTGKDPRPYIISNMVAMKASVAVDEEPSVTVKSPGPPVVPAVKPTKSDASVAGTPSVNGVDEAEINIIKPTKVTKPKTKLPVKPKVKPAEPKIEVAKVITPEPKIKKPVPGTVIVFGNMDFPNLVNGFSVQGDTGTRILDKETSEYVSSQYIFAQAFNC